MAKSDLDDLMSVGIDIGKDVFHLVGFDSKGRRVLRKKIKRLALVSTFEELPRCVVGMEACLSAHFVSRTVRGLGFEPRIIPAIYVKPFSKGQKNDYNDAEAIAEAALRPNLKTVSEKTQDQLDLQALHRVRARLVSRRTATINDVRKPQMHGTELRRTQSLRAQMVIIDLGSNETEARAHSQQGHGEDADTQAGYILATS